MDGDAKRKILARRAKFVAAAVVGISVASCEKKPTPEPCLSVSTVPQACLSAAAQPPDAGPVPELTDAAGDSDAASDATSDASDADATEAGADARPDVPKPHPCLKIAPPHPCLKMPSGDFEP